MGEQVVDIIAYQRLMGDVSLRVYMDNATPEQCAELSKHIMPLMDQELPEEELQGILNQMEEGEELNTIPGKLTLTFLMHGNDGLELMIRTD